MQGGCALSEWRSVVKGVQGSVLVPLLFNIFINGTDSGFESTFSKFAGDTNLSGVVNMPRGWDVIQRDLDRLSRGPRFMRFSRSKWKVLYLGHGNRHYKNKLRSKTTKHSSAKKDFGL